jgi:hypothetical protein
VGDNASGKTTALKPIKLLLDLIFIDKDVSLAIYRCFFSKDRVTTLLYEFEIEKHEVTYSFSFSVNSIEKEKLQVDGEVVLERNGQNGKLILENESEFYNVDNSLLFLKRVYFSTKFSGNDVLIKWMNYLKKSIYINTYSKQITTYDGESLSVFKYIEAHSTDKLNLFFKENHFSYSVQYTRNIEKNGVGFSLDEDDRKMLFFEREEIEVPIPIFMESTGNQTLISILPSILCAVERGGLLIIDEFSSGLHNKLEELLIKYIMQHGLTTQLLFVSHSTNLLSNSLLRPDQIYSVEMMGSEGSKLCRFSDEQPRVAQNLEKMYLSGVFGGIPEYGNDKE